MEILESLNVKKINLGLLEENGDQICNFGGRGGFL